MLTLFPDKISSLDLERVWTGLTADASLGSEIEIGLHAIYFTIDAILVRIVLVFRHG